MDKLKEKQIDLLKMKNDEYYNKPTLVVFKTNEYGKFSLLVGNREINQLHLARLLRSMKEQYLIIPIIVNKDLKIIDGQHRFLNCITLGLPVYYIINESYSLAEVQRLNTNMSNWTYDTYLDGYANLGNLDYIKFKEYKEKYKFGHSELRSMLSGTNTHLSSEEFKTGKFKIKFEEEFLETARKLATIEEFYTGVKRRSFVNCMLALFRNEDFNMDVFIKKLTYQRTKLVDCNTKKEYLLIIEDIYNFNSKIPVLLRYSK